MNQSIQAKNSIIQQNLIVGLICLQTGLRGSIGAKLHSFTNGWNHWKSFKERMGLKVAKGAEIKFKKAGKKNYNRGRDQKTER